jgi:hypothetical protein
MEALQQAAVRTSRVHAVTLRYGTQLLKMISLAQPAGARGVRWMSRGRHVLRRTPGSHGAQAGKLSSSLQGRQRVPQFPAPPGQGNSKLRAVGGAESG